MTDLNKKNMLNDLKGLMKIQSTNKAAGPVTKQAPLGEGINSAIDYVLNLGKKFGFKTKNLGGVCGFIEMGEGEEMIAVLTHVDTVAVGDDWSVPPFDLTIRGDKAMGRGVLDNKGPTLIALYAMKALAEKKTPINKRIRLIVGGDEESGEWSCMKRYKKTEEIPVAAFSPDAGYPAIFAEKGLLKIRLEKKTDPKEIPLDFSGGIQINSVPDKAKAKVNEVLYSTTGKLAHAAEPELGINAILLLAKKLIAEEIKHSFLDLAEMATVKGFNIDFSDALSGKLTLNPSIARVDKEKAVLECDIRYPATIKAEAVEKAIEQKIKPLGFSCTVTQNVLPLHVDQNGFLIQTLQGIYQEVTGDMTSPVAIGGGTYARAFNNAVAFGGKLPEDPNLCHQTDEYWSIESMKKNFDIIVKVLAVLGK